MSSEGGCQEKESVWSNPKTQLKPGSQVAIIGAGSIGIYAAKEVINIINSFKTTPGAILL